MDQADPSLPPPNSVPPLPARDEFRDRTALVTGGTDGLGLHLCRQLVELGAHVFFCGRRRECGEQLRDEWGDHAHFVPCDLADADAARAFVNTAGEFRGHLDYVVNNAAIDPELPLAEIDLELLDRILAVDVRACFLVCQTAVPYLRRGEGKAIVNLGSTNYMLGLPEATAYNAAKMGVVGMSRSLARAVGGDGIRVNVVAPGWIMTERQLRDKASPADRRELLSQQCLKSLLTEQHVTPLTLFLLSRAAAGVTAQQFVVDGGKVPY